MIGGLPQVTAEGIGRMIVYALLGWTGAILIAAALCVIFWLLARKTIGTTRNVHAGAAWVFGLGALALTGMLIYAINRF